MPCRYSVFSAIASSRAVWTRSCPSTELFESEDEDDELYSGVFCSPTSTCCSFSPFWALQSLRSSSRAWCAAAGADKQLLRPAVHLGLPHKLEQAMLCFFVPALIENTPRAHPRDGGILLRCSSDVRPRRELAVCIPHDVGVSRWLCGVKVWVLWSSRRALQSSRRSGSFRSQAKVCGTLVSRRMGKTGALYVSGHGLQALHAKH